MKIHLKLRQLDAYSKTAEDFSIKTLGGAIGEWAKSKHIFHLFTLCNN